MSATTVKAPKKSAPVKDLKIIEVDAVEVEPEEDLKEKLEKDIEKKFSASLVRNKIEDRIIEKLKTDYGDLRLKGLDDHEGYLAIKEARKIVRKVGIVAEKICEKGRAAANLERDLWIKKEKSYLIRVSEIQNPLDEELKRYEDEQERIEIEQARIKEERYHQRQQKIMQMGAQFADGCIVLGTAMYEISLIKDVDEEFWIDSVLPKYVKQFDEINEKKAAEERKRLEEQEKIRQEREALRMQQEEMDRQKREMEDKLQQQRDEMRKQQDEMNRLKLEMEAESRKLQQQKEEAEKSAKQKILNERTDQLVALGLTFNARYSSYVMEDVNVDINTEISLLDNKEWDALIEKITPRINAIKNDLATINRGRARIDSVIPFGFTCETYSYKLLQETGQMSDEEWNTAYLEHKANYDKKLQEIADKKYKEALEEERLKKELELAQANDKTRWNNFVAEIKKIARPEMKSTKYKNVIAIAFEKLEEITSL